MNIYKFTSSNENINEYNYKILVYPNITFQKDLEKDSYVVVLGNIIRELNKVRNDIHWTILSPTEIQSLVFENTTQIPINLPSYPEFTFAPEAFLAKVSTLSLYLLIVPVPLSL